ncbi:MAG TPA: helix-turn-helix domain-containing protein [Pseudomonadales bacterium]|nr:helix-turn-helix domain-containing protein [Pseudomonadales bacterium]
MILDVTRNIVAAEGFRAATLERIAHDCGVTRTLLYQQFTNLGGLLVALIDRESLRAYQGFQKALQPSGHKAPVLAAFAGILDAVHADPDTWRMFLLPSEGGPAELYERLAAARAMTRTYLTDVITSAGPAATERLFLAEDPELVLHLIHSTADELVRLHLQAPEKFTRERLMAYAERMAYASGLLRDKSAPQNAASASR